MDASKHVLLYKKDGFVEEDQLLLEITVLRYVETA
jgi:hypothetical protein